MAKARMATMKSQFKAALVTHPGFEDVAALEIKELVGATATTAAAGILVFDVKDLADLCRLCYLSQSASSVLFLLSSFSIEKSAEATFRNLRQSLADTNFKEWLSPDSTFKAVFGRTSPNLGSGSDSDLYVLPSSEIEAKAGSIIIAVLGGKSKLKVDLKSPSVTVSVFASGSVGFCGILISPFDLGKREYRVFGHSSDIPGDIAYAILRLSSYSGQSLLDPFTRAGTVAIEAAFMSSGFPVNYYRKEALSSAFSRLPPLSSIDFSKFFASEEKRSAAAAKKRFGNPNLQRPIGPSRSGNLGSKIIASSSSMQFVRCAEKNAKIAGVHKLMRFSRLDIEWLDAKLDEKTVDLVVSYPPQFKSVSSNDSFAAAENEKLRKMYKDFFYHADFFLKKGGEVTLMLRNGWDDVAAAAAKQKFKPRVVRKFLIGSSAFELVSFSR